MGKRADDRPPTPKDVFDRSNMPSRWERLTGVSPRIDEDRKFLAFVAARYKGEPRLPHPGALVVPAEVRRRQNANFVGGWASVAAIVVTLIGVAAQLSFLTAVGLVVLIVSVGYVASVSTMTAVAVAGFTALKSRCAAAQARVHSEFLDPEYQFTLDKMITCDEGTLAYCAAKIASEIEREPAWSSGVLEVITIDLWNEVAEIGHSARLTAEDRESTERLLRGRLRDDPEVKATIEADKRAHGEAISLLAARVNAFADYRDKVQRLGMAALRDSRTVSRAMRLAADELAAHTLR